MSNNALIPLMGEPVQFGQSANQGIVAANNLYNLQENKRTEPLRMEALKAETDVRKTTADATREDERLKSIAIASQDSLALANDPAAMLSYWKARKSTLAAHGKPTDDSDKMISVLESGDHAKAVEMAKYGVDLGYTRGYFQAPPKPAAWGNLTPDAQGNMWGTNPETGQFGRAPGTEGVSFRENTGPSYGQPVSGIGPDGNPMFARFDKNGNMVPVEGFQPMPQKNGMTIKTNEDGTFEWSMGGPAGGGQGGTTNSTASKIEQAILENDESMQHLIEIEASFKPEYLEYGTKYGAEITNLKDRWGQLDPNSMEAQQLREYSDFTSATSEYFAKKLKAMSGGAVSESEGVRQKGWIPNAETDGPVQFETKMKRSIKFIRSANARLHYARSQGLSQSQMFGIPLDSVPSMINARGAELEAQGLTPEQVSTQLRQEFGL